MMANDLDRYIIAFTGAGISKESGIPTFDEMPGIRDRLTRHFAETNPTEYNSTLESMRSMMLNKQPNPAHIALASLGCTILTMNVDQLHQSAGSQRVMELHGSFQESLVLYRDYASKYADAIRMVTKLAYHNSYFIVIGTSFYTDISTKLVHRAKQRHSRIITINKDASIEVPKAIERIRMDLRSMGIAV